MQFQSSSLNTNDRMYLYDTASWDTMAKDLMLQSLCSTSTWKALGIMPNTSNYLFMCSRASRSTQSVITHVLQSSLLNTNHQSLKCSRASHSTQIINHSSAPELPAQHKTSHQSYASGSTPNTNKHIHIPSIIGLHTIYKRNHHVHM